MMMELLIKDLLSLKCIHTHSYKSEYDFFLIFHKKEYKNM